MLPREKLDGSVHSKLQSEQLVIAVATEYLFWSNGDRLYQ